MKEIPNVTIENATTVNEAWRYFASQVFSESTRPVQIREMRKAFYAGASAMLVLVSNASNGTEEAGAAQLDALDNELHAFSEEIVREHGRQMQAAADLLRARRR